MAQSMRMVALALVALVVVAASVPAATAYGCYEDCYLRCDNGKGKPEPACTKLCDEGCGSKEQGMPKGTGGVPP